MKDLNVRSNTNKLVSKRYSLKEEIANSITHGIGVVFSIVALTILIVYAVWKKSPINIVAFSIYGLCLTAMFTFSTLYHSFQKEKLKKLFRIFDHSAIYLFIAGTYTPISLLVLKGYWRIGVLVSVWTIALLGILFKIITYKKLDKYRAISLIIYIAMGWMAVITANPIIKALSIRFFLWILAGGLIYTFGTIFYAIKRIPFNHAIWHLFVLAGSVVHFLAIFFYLR